MRRHPTWIPWALFMPLAGLLHAEPVPLNVPLPLVDSPGQQTKHASFLQKPPYLGKHDGWTSLRSDQDPSQVKPATKTMMDQLKPSPFVDAKGRERGWRVDLGTERPVPTPAYHRGKLIVAGGFATHSVVCFSSLTGGAEWHYRTRDIGPNAPVVNDDALVVHTESCELEVLTPAGKPVWKRWLGDPLMAMPTLHQGRVYTCYPAAGRKAHMLAAFDVKTGDLKWEVPVEGDVIGAPLVHDGEIYVSTLGGRTHRVGSDGEFYWAESVGATSSPMVAGDKSFFTLRKTTPEDQVLEGLGWRSLDGDGKVTEVAGSFRPAPYLDPALRATSSLQDLYKKMDSRAGFSIAPAMAKIDQASSNLGQSTVMGVFQYQGGIGSVADGRLFTLLGDEVAAHDVSSGRKLWKRTLPPVDPSIAADRRGSPPVAVNGKVFLGTAAGTFHCLRARDGKELWRVDLSAPVRSQPVVAAGHAYVACEDGTLFGIRTGDPEDDGWMMWGGSPSHDGPVKSSN